MRFAFVLGSIGLAACAHNVPQDRTTGQDGRIKGATPLVLEDGEGKTSGIVTYPGGDRIDWKLIELPEGKRGQLDLQLTFTTPRPGLQLSFDVFDEWNTPVAVAKGSRRQRETTIARAKGKYFVRVFAPKRGDAGRYKLVAAFHEERTPPRFDPTQLVIPLPPRLADVPEPIQPCDTFDPTNPSCPGTCPIGAPPAWPGCKTPTTTTPPVATPPTPPVPPPPVHKPLIGRFIKHVVLGDVVEITVPYGASSGVTDQWKARVLRGDTTSPLANGSAKIIRINSDITVLHVKLVPDLLKQNPRVQLEPPPTPASP